MARVDDVSKSDDAAAERSAGGRRAGAAAGGREGNEPMIEGNGGDEVMSDTTRGLHNKYVVVRTDGSSVEGGKHHGCRYFVLDLDHDQHAVPALLAYARSCVLDSPQLAADLWDVAADVGRKHAAAKLAQEEKERRARRTNP